MAAFQPCQPGGAGSIPACGSHKTKRDVRCSCQLSPIVTTWGQLSSQGQQETAGPVSVPTLAVRPTLHSDEAGGIIPNYLQVNVAM